MVTLLGKQLLAQDLLRPLIMFPSTAYINRSQQGTGTFIPLIVTGTELRDSPTVNAQTDLNGLLNVNDTTESTTSTTGALVVDGGVGIAKILNVEGDIIARTFKNTDVGILHLKVPLKSSAKNSLL